MSRLLPRWRRPVSNRRRAVRSALALARKAAAADLVAAVAKALVVKALVVKAPVVKALVDVPDVCI